MIRVFGAKKRYSSAASKAAIHAQRSIFLAETSVSGQSYLSLHLHKIRWFCSDAEGQDGKPTFAATQNIARTKRVVLYLMIIALDLSPKSTSGRHSRLSQNRHAIYSGPGKLNRHGQNERELALNRKNALFAGHDEGGKSWGRIASLIETCKLNGVEPYAYLKATLEAIAAGHPAARIDELMPWNFKKQA